MKISSLIVGLDPGTNISYSLVDLEGNIIKIKSLRNKGINFIVKDIIKYGNVLAVGADKYPTPEFVKKFASMFGARLFRLDKQIDNEKKKDIIKNYNLKNKHEKDSLVAALIAYKKLGNLFNKIDRYLAKQGLLGMSHKVKQLMVKNEEGLTLYEAVEKIRYNKF